MFSISPLSGALAGFIYATSLGFYKSPSRLLLRVVLLGLLHIGPSRSRYTNNGYPKGIPMSVAPECLGKSKTCVETPSIIISEVEEIQGEVHVVDLV